MKLIKRSFGTKLSTIGTGQWRKLSISQPVQHMSKQSAIAIDEYRTVRLSCEFESSAKHCAQHRFGNRLQCRKRRSIAHSAHIQVDGRRETSCNLGRLVLLRSTTARSTRFTAIELLQKWRWFTIAATVTQLVTTTADDDANVLYRIDSWCRRWNSCRNNQRLFIVTVVLRIDDACRENLHALRRL